MALKILLDCSHAFTYVFLFWYKNKDLNIGDVDSLSTIVIQLAYDGLTFM